MDKRITLYTSTGTARYQNVVFSSVAATTSTAIYSSRVLITVAGASAGMITYLAFGTNPTASTSGFAFPSNIPLEFNFNSGDKVSVLASAGTGVISIVPLV
jgi:hypothetical protein